MSHDEETRDRAQRRELRAFFEEVHQLSPQPPPFHALLPNSGRRATGWTWRLGLAAGGALAAAALVLLLSSDLSPWTESAPSVGEEAIELALVASLDNWQGPLDFLLRTPGRDLIASIPRLDTDVPTYHIEPLIESSKEILP